MSFQKKVKPSELYNFLLNPPQTKQELYRFLYLLTGEKTVFKNICDFHQTPWDFIWESYKIDLPDYKESSSKNIVALGPREGFKTLSEAKLIVSELLLKPNCETICMGAIREQSEKCFSYVRRYLKNSIVMESGILDKMLKRLITLRNGSKYHQVVATVESTNGQHPQKLRIDECELIEQDVITEARMMPSGNETNDAHIAYISTRKFVDGTMQKLLERTGKDAYKFISWCYKEVSEPCPEWRRGKDRKIYNVEDIHNPGETIIIEAYSKCGECPLLPSCRGDLAKSTGSIPIEDSINKFLTTDRTTWIAQKECLEPVRQNKFFPEWDRKFNIIDYEYNPHRPTDLAFDFTNGGESPTVCQIWQEDDEGNSIMFASLAYVHKPSNDTAESILNFVRDIGIKNTRMQVGDSAQMQEIRNFNNYNSFFRIVPTKKITRKEGWPICRRTLRDNSGRRKLFVNQKYCQGFIKEIEEATRSKRDLDDIATSCSDHHLDAWRYREVRLRHQGGGEPNIRVYNPDGADDASQSGPVRIDDEKPLINNVWDYLSQEDDD